MIETGIGTWCSVLSCPGLTVLLLLSAFSYLVYSHLLVLSPPFLKVLSFWAAAFGSIADLDVHTIFPKLSLVSYVLVKIIVSDFDLVVPFLVASWPVVSGN